MSVIYNGTDLEQEFGMVCLGRGTYGAPARDIEQIHVPGRNGDLLIDNGGYLNFDITYPECTIQEDFPYQARRLRNFLLESPGYHKLTDSYNPGFYRQAEFRGPFTAEAHTARNNMSSVFDLTFNCKPMRYLGDDAGAPRIVLVGSGTTRVPYVSNRHDGYSWVNIYNDGTDALTVSISKIVPNESIATVTVQGGDDARVQADSVIGDMFMVTVNMGSSSSIRIFANGNLLYSRNGGSVVVRNGFERAECRTTFYNWKGSIAHTGGAFALTNDSSYYIDSESWQMSSANDSRYMSGMPMYFKPGQNNITITTTGEKTGQSVYADPRFCIL